ncbi:MAG: class I SAM-dependent methyltransferase [Thermosynechococcaceae cyanobacterium]
MLAVDSDKQIRTNDCPDCYLCQAKGNLLYQNLRDRIFNALGNWNLKQCSNPDCGLVWLDPMPFASEIGKAYETYCTHDSNEVTAKASGLRSLIWRACHAVWLTSFSVLGVKQEKISLDNLYLIQKPGRLLEVGCGAGKYLNRMKQSGWEVEGVDFDPKVAKTVADRYSINIHTGTLESIGYADQSFDAVTMNHVIEHIPDPVALLKECNRILKPGGSLIVVTPNISAWGHQQFGSSWLHLDPPRHLFLFSQETLKSCAQKAGFGQMRTLTTSIRAASCFAGSLEIQKSGRHMIMNPSKLNLFRGMLFQIYSILFKKQRNSGEEAVLIIQKASD